MIEPGMKTPPADSSTAVTTKYTEAFNLNARIRISAQMAQQNLYEVCKGLKEMRDGKLYKELGYQTLAEYSENEVGIKGVQASRMISIIEKLPEDFLSPGINLGVSKLYLLSTLSEAERTEITEKNNVADMSKRDLETKIADLKKANERLMEKIDEAEKKVQKSHKSETDAWGKAGILETDNEFYKMKIQQLEAENKKKNEDIIGLEETIEQLESRPVEVAVQVNNEEVDKLKSIIKQTDLDWSQKYTELEDESIKLRREDSQKHAAEIENLKKEYEEKLASVPQPETVPDTKEVFKAYLANAVDSANRLLVFVNQHKEELFISKTKEFFNTVTKKLEV